MDQFRRHETNARDYLGNGMMNDSEFIHLLSGRDMD